jgi:hypothetical protein
MNDPSLAVQKGVYTALSAALGSVAKVYDRVPLQAGKVAAEFPYVHIGEDQIVPDTDQCHDAFSAFVTIHVWSRAVGKVEAKGIMASCITALAVNLPLDGFQVVTWLVTDIRHMTDTDGLTSHSVATVHYRLGPV